MIQHAPEHLRACKLGEPKLFDTAAELTAAQLTHAAWTSSFCDLLVHLVDVQRTWLARAQHTVTPPLDQAACSTLAALREAWKSIDDASRIYVAGLKGGGSRRDRALHQYQGRAAGLPALADFASPGAACRTASQRGGTTALPAWLFDRLAGLSHLRG